MQHIPVVTIDGPSGSGKGTISQLLAEKLGWHFLDSGALYRVLAYAAQKYRITADNYEKLTKIAGRLPVQFQAQEIGKAPAIIFEEEDVTKAVRTEACGTLASKIAIHPPIRAAILQRQRDFRKAPGLVADGRDMGTVVFPDADVKFFLSASLEERAQRRYKQLKEQGAHITLEQMLDELTARDVRDKERSTAPLKPAADAQIIDTTHLSIHDVLLKILAEVAAKLGIPAEKSS